MDERLKYFTDDDLRQELRERREFRKREKESNKDIWRYWEGIIISKTPYNSNIYLMRYKIKGIGLKEEEEKIINDVEFKLQQGLHFTKRQSPSVGDKVLLRCRANSYTKTGQIQNSKIFKLLDKIT